MVTAKPIALPLGEAVVFPTGDTHSQIDRYDGEAGVDCNAQASSTSERIGTVRGVREGMGGC